MLEFEAGEAAVFAELAGLVDVMCGVVVGDGIEGDGHVGLGVVGAYVEGGLWGLRVCMEDWWFYTTG